MGIEKLNRAARAAGCAMAPPVELFEEPKQNKVSDGWAEAKHAAVAAPQQRSGWRDLFSGWTTKATA